MMWPPTRLDIFHRTRVRVQEAIFEKNRQAIAQATSGEYNVSVLRITRTICIRDR